MVRSSAWPEAHEYSQAQESGQARIPLELPVCFVFIKQTEQSFI